MLLIIDWSIYLLPNSKLPQILLFSSVAVIEQSAILILPTYELIETSLNPIGADQVSMATTGAPEISASLLAVTATYTHKCPVETDENILLISSICAVLVSTYL